MQALIVRDQFDDLKQVQSLYTHLEGFKIIEIKSIRELNAAKILLDSNMPCLFYKNIFMRLENPKEIWAHHKSMIHNNIVKIDQEVISFIPKAINNFARDINNIIYFAPEFAIINRKLYFEIPSEKPICFLYTHNRDIYLKLTLNSLLYATQDIDLKIVLNDPTPNVEKIALEFASKYKNIELFKTDNAFISATNLMIQWFNPKRFIFMEDDMLYPSSTKDFFPNFCYQFISRLDYFDLCLWKVTIDNSPKYLAHKRNTFEFLESEWEIWEKGSNHFLMAQCVACRTDYYRNVLRFYLNKDENVKKYYSNYDVHLILQANSICHPSLRGYHVGWNQEMDGFVQLTNANRYPTFKSYKFEVKNLNTGESRNIDIRDLL